MKVPHHQPETEEWRAVLGYEGIYEVSSERRLRTIVKRYNGYTSPRSEPLIITPKKNGNYVSTRLFKGGQGKTMYFHRMVLEAFDGPAPAGTEAAHLDGDYVRNWISNLLWKTPLENAADRDRHGKTPIGSRHGNAKLTEEAVAEIRISGERSVILAQRYGVGARTIRSVRSENVWSHVKC